MIHLKVRKLVNGSIDWAKIASVPDAAALRTYLREHGIAKTSFSPRVDCFRAYDGAKWIGVQALTRRGVFA